MNHTLVSLWKSTLDIKDGSRKFPSSSPNLRLVKVVPFVGARSILYQFSMFGVTQKSIHKVNIIFSGLEVLTSLPKKHGNYEKVVDKYGEHWVEKPHVSKAKVRVRCSCKDFYYTFGYYNWKNGALFGAKPRPYKRKTTTRPPRNPKGLVGFCKHIHNVAVFMQTRGNWLIDNNRI